MNRIRHTWLASVLTLATTAAAVAQDSIPWITDLSQARRIAEQQQRLVLLHFWGDGCQPCQQLEANVFNQPELIRVLSTNFVCVKVHVQQQQNIANHYKITQIPTDVIVLPSGVQVFRTASPANANTYIAMLDQVRVNALASGFQQVDRARNAVQQLAQNLPALTGRSPEEQPATQPVNSEHSRQGNSSQPWRNAPAAPAGSANPSQNSVVNNEFVGPLDQPQASRPEPQASRPATSSRYGNPYLNDSVAATTANQTQGNPPSNAQTTSGANSVPTKESPANAAPEITAQANLPFSNGQVSPENTPAAVLPSHVVPSPALGNQSWTPPSQVQSNIAPTGPQHGDVAQSSSPHANTSHQKSLPHQNLPQLPPGVPPLALDGHCPVTLMNLGKWEKGDPRFGAVHRDRTYLFKSQVERDRFLSPGAADRFAPVLSGFDPVRFAETGQAVDGRREHGVLFDNQIFLFADEEALVRFEQQPQRYVAVVRQAMANTRGAAPQR